LAAFPIVSVLSPEQIKAIDKATRELLQTTGIKFHNQEALDFFDKGGAKVDRANKRVYITDSLFNETVEKCGSSVSLFARDGHPTITLGGDKVFYGTGGFATQCLDGKTMQYRPTLTEDLVRFARLYETLERPHFGITQITPTDVPPAVSDLVEFKVMATNTKKHLLIQAKHGKHLDLILDMAEMASGISREEYRRNPWFSIMICITSPLFQRSELSDLIISAARFGVPMVAEAGPMAGATSPATMGHTLVQTNAENFGAITLAKLVNPEVPIVYASWSRIFDMKWAVVSQGGPEFGLQRIGTTQMAKFYNMPSGGGGCLTESKFLDSQYGFEKMVTTLLPAVAGCNLILGMGLTADQDAHSAEALVIDEEITCYIDRVRDGLKVEADTTDIGIIDKVGPEGAFLEEMHTLKHFRQEMYIPKVCNRQPATHGADLSRRTILESTQAKIEKLLGSWKGPQIPDGAVAKMDKVIADRASDLGVDYK